MKVSKVNNVRFAVVNKADDQKSEHMGVLYKSPKNTIKTSDLRNVVKERVKKASIKKKTSDNGPQKRYDIDSLTKSIKNQNLVVQTKTLENDKDVNNNDESGESTHIIGLSERTGGSKAKLDKAFGDFLKEYATLDKEYRKECLDKIRNIVKYFYYGGSAFYQTEDKYDHFVVLPEELKKTGEDNNEDNVKKITQYVLRISRKRYDKCIVHIVKNKRNPGCFFDNEDLNVFWIRHIQACFENLLNNKIAKKGKYYRFDDKKLFDATYREAINYLCVKYIAIGKMVYKVINDRLSEDDHNTTNKKDIDLIGVNDRYKDGFDSFMLEDMKAEEELQRNISVYCSFAINNLREALDVKGDILFDKNKGSEDTELNTTRILQYFGGKSRWQKFFDMSDMNADDLCKEVKSSLSRLRNSSFHYFTNESKEDSDALSTNTIIGEMLKWDAKAADMQIVEKIYSNNLPMFYNKEDLREAIGTIYSKTSERKSQVPAFNTVIVRKNLKSFLADYCNIPVDKLLRENKVDEEMGNKWLSAVYYLLKEIYYSHFLRDAGCINSKGISYTMTLFNKNISKLSNASNNSWAVNDFKEYVKSVKEGRSLSEICQMINTEYERQNNSSRKIKSADGLATGKIPKNAFPHFKIFLNQTLMGAFSDFLKSYKKSKDSKKNIYSFLARPRFNKVNPDKDEFINFILGGEGENAFEYYSKNSEVLNNISVLEDWYVLGRMLSPKCLNNLSGSLRRYIQYKTDISNRKKTLKKYDGETELELGKIGRIKIVLGIFDICSRLSGAVSNNLKDYFADEEEYAKFIYKFFDYQFDGHSYASSLNNFCNYEDVKRIGIYYDGNNPIINKNIILAKLYGNAEKIAAVLENDKVDIDDIKSLNKAAGKLQSYRLNGKVKNDEEQNELNRYQHLKNHVEFRDIVDYAELINDLQANLIEWACLRERDLMFFHLGFHYSVLSKKRDVPAEYYLLKDNGRYIKGGILYQIFAMYSYDMEMYCGDIDKQGNEKKKKGSVGNKVKLFCTWSGKLTNKRNNKGYYDEDIYTAGLELFEMIEDHDKYIELRRFIDHFHYYYEETKSMIELYGEVFDGFFSYDNKLRKNVPVVLYNILMRYLVNVTFRFEDDPANGIINIRNAKSEKFTYLINNKKRLLYARQKEYILNVLRMLYYPFIPEDLKKRIKVKD